MEIVCPAGFPVHAVRWRTAAGHAYATILCKATFTLEPGRSPLAVQQDPFGTTSSAEGTSAHPATTSDGAPFKPRAEVLVVGSAHARAPTTRAIARVVVGDVDKSLAVLADRTLTSDGRVLEGAGFTRMPIGWDRTAGGPDTWNPIGVGDHLRDPRGQVRLPNVVGPGAEEDGVPRGFGPLPAAWSPRRQYAGRGAITRDGALFVLPADLDPQFFQSAPLDQQSGSAFDADTRLVLEGLHPEHARLVTNLAPLFALATIVSAYRNESRALLADTLWIDTDTSRCWLLFRTVVPLGADETAQVRIDTASRYDELDEASTTASRRPAMPSLPDAPSGERLMTTELAIERELTHVGLEIVDEPSHLPFRTSGAHTAAPAPPPPRAAVVTAVSPSKGALPSPLPVASPVVKLTPPPPLAASPAPWGSQKPAGAPSAIDAVRPERIVPVRPVEVAPASLRPARAPEDALAASNRAAGSRAEAGGEAAADRAPREPREVEPGEAPRAAGATARGRAVEPLELLWVEADLVDRLRATAAFDGLLAARGRRALRDEPVPADEAERKRADVLRVLSTAASTEPAAFEQAHAAAVDRVGGVRPPLVVVQGEMVLRFDEREQLRAVIGVAGPFGSLDKSVKEAVEFATLVADSEWSGTSTIEAAGTRVREALARAARDVGPQVLDATVQRKLLERRRFRAVTLLGGAWFRADLVADGARAPVPLYVPESLRDALPLFERLPVRAVAELRRRQDGAEANPDALFVRALARRLGR